MPWQDNTRDRTGAFENRTFFACGDGCRGNRRTHIRGVWFRLTSPSRRTLCRCTRFAGSRIGNGSPFLLTFCGCGSFAADVTDLCRARGSFWASRRRPRIYLLNRKYLLALGAANRFTRQFRFGLKFCLAVGTLSEEGHPVAAILRTSSKKHQRGKRSPHFGQGRVKIQPGHLRITVRCFSYLGG